MRTLLVVGVLVGLVVAVGALWMLLTSTSRGVPRQKRAWRATQWTPKPGVLAVGVRRYYVEPNTGGDAAVADEVIVATIADSVEEWLDWRAAAWAEATQRATELNLADDEAATDQERP